LNPNIDYGDPHNLRFGIHIFPSMAHNVDLVLGKTKDKLYANFGLGYNIVEDIYSQVRTLLPDGKHRSPGRTSAGEKNMRSSVGQDTPSQIRCDSISALAIPIINIVFTTEW
jgi:hypothetical protein